MHRFPDIGSVLLGLQLGALPHRTLAIFPRQFDVTSVPSHVRTANVDDFFVACVLLPRLVLNHFGATLPNRNLLVAELNWHYRCRTTVPLSTCFII